MIIEYDEVGRITHIINDPVPPHMADFLEDSGHRFLDLPPVPWPAEPQFDGDNNPLLDDYGRQVMASNGMDSVECDILSDYVVGGEIVRRPDCPAAVTVNGRAISIAGLPEGASVTVTIDDVTIPVNAATIEMDEPGPVTVTITPPWPYLEAVHDLEIE